MAAIIRFHFFCTFCTVLLPSNLVKSLFRDTVCTAFHVDFNLADDARVIRYVKALTGVMLKGF